VIPEQLTANSCKGFLYVRDGLTTQIYVPQVFGAANDLPQCNVEMVGPADLSLERTGVSGASAVHCGIMYQMGQGK